MCACARARVCVYIGMCVCVCVSVCMCLRLFMVTFVDGGDSSHDALASENADLSSQVT